jgi:polyhydroxyalkanoate synthesis regulator phasin
MLNLIKKAMLTGIGLSLIAKDEVEELAKELINKSKMSEKEGTKFIDELQKKYDETQNRLEERVQQTAKEFLKKADVVTSDELRGLKKEIRELKKAMSKETDASD